MITLKTFSKLNSNIHTEYTVFEAGTDNCVDWFDVNYLAEDDSKRRRGIDALLWYEGHGAKVCRVSTNHARPDVLSVTLECNTWKETKSYIEH